MISKVSIRNFKCLRDVQVDLERFTIFVGANASGKSSVLQALDLLVWSFRDQSGNVENELSQGMTRGVNASIELAVECGGKGYRYRTRSPVPPGNSPTQGPTVMRPGPAWSGEGRGVASSLASPDWKLWPPTTPPPLPLSVLLRLETSKLVLANPYPSDPTVMAPDGTGLHSALASMALNDPDSWQQLQADLKRIIPTIRRLRHTKAAMHQNASLLFDTVGGDSLLAHQVSEGTLLVLGLLAALHASSGSSLLLLDDVDRGLHPRAQRDLIALLRGLLETKPDLQLIATTHSPYLLDWMEPKEVRITDLRDDGTTVCAPLASHPRFPKWKDEMAPGELWSLFGEKWLTGQEVGA